MFIVLVHLACPVLLVYFYIYFGSFIHARLGNVFLPSGFCNIAFATFAATRGHHKEYAAKSRVYHHRHTVKMRSKLITMFYEQDCLASRRLAGATEKLRYAEAGWQR